METEHKYLYTKAYYKIRDLIINNPNEDVFVIRGGQGASKTVSIIQLIIQALVSSTKEATVLSSELSKMKRTVIRDYNKICKDWNIITDMNDFNRSESKHEYKNGSYIDFLGADVTDVGKGFRRDILYINEADKMDIDAAVQFISRAGLTIIDYNPDKLFWGDDYINENNFITLTFEDNEYLSKSEVRSILDYKAKGFYDLDLPITELFKDVNIKSKYWANKWRVYGLGMVGSLDGVVFDNWKPCDAIPQQARLLGYGCDFGYSNDPSTLVAVYQLNNEFYYDELIYQKGLLNSDLARLIKQHPTAMIYADSAEPKSIQEIKNYGIRITATEKGADSIMHGISKMQQAPFYVTKRSLNLIKELRAYTWATDKTGATLNKPIDAFNHAIDAMRYYHLGQGKYSGNYVSTTV